MRVLPGLELLEILLLVSGSRRCLTQDSMLVPFPCLAIQDASLAPFVSTALASVSSLPLLTSLVLAISLTAVLHQIYETPDATHDDVQARG